MPIAFSACRADAAAGLVSPASEAHRRCLRWAASYSPTGAWRSDAVRLLAAATTVEATVGARLWPAVLRERDGWLLTARGAGGLAGGLLANYVVAAAGPRASIAAGLGASALLLLVVLHTASFPLALVLLAAVGVPSVVWAVAHQTLLQRSTADDYRGRVFGALGTAGASLGLLGTGLAGALAAPVGTVAMPDLTCGLTLLAGMIALLGLRGAVAAPGSPH